MAPRPTRAALAVATRLALCVCFQRSSRLRSPATSSGALVRSPTAPLRSGNEDGFVDEIDDGAGPDDFALAEDNELDVGAGSGFLDAWARLFLARDSAFLFQRPVLAELEDESLEREEDKAPARVFVSPRRAVMRTHRPWRPAPAATVWTSSRPSRRSRGRR